jgi:hypothetical protein
MRVGLLLEVLLSPERGHLSFRTDQSCRYSARFGQEKSFMHLEHL